MGSLSLPGRDLRLALRHLRRTPLVSGVALLSLALGIGANVAIFSVINALILKALPVHEPERLVVVTQPTPMGRMPYYFSHPQWEYLRDHQDAFAGVAAVASAGLRLGGGGDARPVPGVWVNARFFDTLGVTPVLGRTFTGADDRRGGGPDGPVVVVSHGFWQREYGGDPSVIGRTLVLDGQPFRVIGVTPAEFFGVTVGEAFDVALPFTNEPLVRAESMLDRRTWQNLNVIARLAPGQTLAQAEARLRALQPGLREATRPQDLAATYQARYLKDPFMLEPATTGVSWMRSRYSRPLYILLGLVGLVLAIACVNMANLLLAQSLGRRREIAVRLSLGASRWQLMRQLLVESVMLSIAGAAAGLLVARWASRALIAMLSTGDRSVSLDLSMDWRLFAFTASIGVVTGLLFGVVPAVRGTALSPVDALRDQARGGVRGGSRLSVGHGLVALQVALSFLLVFAAGLFVRTLAGLTSQNVGFEPARVLIASVDLQRTGVEAEARLPLFERIRDAVAAVPGVEAAAVSFTTPISNDNWSRTITVPGYTGSERERNVRFNAVTPGYFRALGTPVLAGRDIGREDRPGAPDAALVNEAFVRRFMPGANPLGRGFVLDRLTADFPEVRVEIVGLVPDAKYTNLRETAPPTLYVSMAQQDNIVPITKLTIRTTGTPLASRDAIVRAIGTVDPRVVFGLRTLTSYLDANVTQERLIASLSAVFGGLALLLATIGLYGVMSYSVTRRTSEIGIRMALGAEPRRVMTLVLGQVAAITAAGLVAGAVAAIAAGRFIQSLLFNLTASDATMIVVTTMALGGVAAVAGYLPARRAARIDPTVALRSE